MGWITNINFLDGVELNGTKVARGVGTQVRWDLGIGGFNIDKNGKILPDVWHGHPFAGKAKDDYEKELANWTGPMDTTMGVLFFKEGQLCHLDLCLDDVGSYLLNHTGTDWACQRDQIYRSMTLEAFEAFEKEINEFREKLLSDSPLDEEDPDEYAFSVARKIYKERTGEITDPYYARAG
jgi:hypothetical protein